MDIQSRQISPFRIRGLYETGAIDLLTNLIEPKPEALPTGLIQLEVRLV